jgi:Enoyl-(Acyl carrier protein) reductase
VARAATFRDTLDPDGLHASVHQGNVGDPDDCLRVVHEVIEPDKAMERIRAAIPMGRIGRPEEVARVVRFLAADSSSYITGQVWRVNGGYDM